MLTGDKLETAENIAKSCKLIQQDMTVMTFADKTIEGTIAKMAENMEILNLCLKQNRKKSLLIDGESLGIPIYTIYILYIYTLYCIYYIYTIYIPHIYRIYTAYIPHIYRIYILYIV